MQVKRTESSEIKDTEAVALANPFSRANILAAENKIRLVDTDEETGLDLFCYNRCSNEAVSYTHLTLPTKA